MKTITLEIEDKTYTELYTYLQVASMAEENTFSNIVMARILTEIKLGHEICTIKLKNPLDTN